MATGWRLDVSKYKVCDVTLVSSSFLHSNLQLCFYLPCYLLCRSISWFSDSSCSNVNFAFRGVCNRCGSARPTGVSGGGRGSGRGVSESGNPGHPAPGSTALFGPNDWSCPMCANINWAKRLKCNICNTNKPGHNEGGVRGGRAGGYKELDEEELEETKRRRKEADEDDGELYDEFGNLKKKFRAKTHRAEAGQVLPGAGRAGWEVEEIVAGVADRDGGERNRERGRKRDDRGNSNNRERDDRDRRRSRSRERDRGRDRDRDYDHCRNRDYGRNRDHDRSQYRH
ncbi:transcription initiation factor TFIID subunit 15 [Tripterygium wilfordii]|uniref:Transcription initiation factor TFIID subunit 15 n=1 Tax=Tripterygium wilfordii TaxID=458696 RepID=A0A7J7CV84_TRIWF|nr:transcription initiation factor TFIID subunit 15 [Tripterygium wilfordii]